MPQVTVLMTVYNGMPFLPAAIESILAQTFSDFEFLIVNDCSTDNSRDIILSYADPRIRLLDNESNLKQTKSINRGLEHARCDLIARMDADDISHPKRLEMLAAYLANHTDVVAVGSGLRFIDPSGNIIRSEMRPEHDVAIRWMQLFSCPISGGAVMFRKSTIWDQLGGFDPSIHLAQDYELWSRMPRERKLANLPVLLYDVRRHPNAETVAWPTVADAEHERICRASAVTILGLSIKTDPWLNNLDLLIPWPHPARHARADQLVDVLQRLYGRFSQVYAAGASDKDVLNLLSSEYFRAASDVGWTNLASAIKALRLAWPITPKTTYFTQLARTMAVWMGARALKRWQQKKAGISSRR